MVNMGEVTLLNATISDNESAQDGGGVHIRGQWVAPFSSADRNGSLVVDDADYSVWKANFGTTLPGPASSFSMAPSAEEAE